MSDGALPMSTLSETTFLTELSRLRRNNPLVHCLTNEVVQEVTANVLLAAGASPAMIVDKAEAPLFARIAASLLVNVGTLTSVQFESMVLAAQAAADAAKPWVLDPVAAGLMPWRDARIEALLNLAPTVVRGNASEILALAGMGAGGKGVDAVNTSDEALAAAADLACRRRTIVCVTGATDYVTDGTRTIEVAGGSPMATLVVGTGCSLSALVAAFVAKAPDPLAAAAAACALAKRASEKAAAVSKGPGHFREAYLDALYTTGR